MLKHLQRIAKEKKCTGIVLHTGKDNELAKKFYRKNGMEENVMFKLDL
ncbi:MAG: GNAT family N-acetyltransferase [Nitrososphaerales archaeon]